jgi:hypothetical protein
LIDIHSSSLVSQIVLGYREIIPSELTIQPVIEKSTPLSRQFPFIQGVFEGTEPQPEEDQQVAHAAAIVTVTATDGSSTPPDNSRAYFVKELSLVELGDLRTTLEASQLLIDPLSQSDLGSYLKQQGIPPWLSPGLGKIRSQSVDFDLPETPFWSDASSSGCGLLIARVAGAEEGKQEGEGEMLCVGIKDIVAVFSVSFVYRNLFAAIAVRDHLQSLSPGRLLPLYVLVIPPPSFSPLDSPSLPPPPPSLLSRTAWSQ